MKHTSLAAALLLTACANAPLMPRHTPFPLVGSSWQRSDDVDASPHYATVVFGVSSASGFAGCNSWSANFTTDGRNFRFGPIATTRIMCPPASMQTEQNFLPAIEVTRSFRLEGEDLLFIDADGGVVARFICAQEPCPKAP